MDFFQAQDVARRKSKLLVVYFLAAIVSIIAVIYAVTIAVMTQGPREPHADVAPFNWWQPDVFAIVALATTAVILLGSLFKSLALRAGGGAVARSVGGVRVNPDTTDLTERRLLNVVEEMAIASGVRVPEVYILPEPGINAFAAGLSPDDAAVAVTRGALDLLSRDELQGVVAHEFSHILNGDMRLNVRLIGLLFGILLLAIIGRVVVHSMRFGRVGGSRGRGRGGGAPAILLVGITLIVVGYIGVLFGRLIQAAVSRQREFLADASAVQFTRNPGGISGALKKIGGYVAGARVRSAHATETAHMFFANALSASAVNLFATHPPLVERIRAIEPDFNGEFPPVAPPRAARATEPSPARAARQRPPPLPAEQFVAAITAAVAADPATGAALIEAMPPSLRDAAHDPARVRAIVLALVAETADAAAGRRQSKILGEVLSAAEVQAGAEAVALLDGLGTAERLALLDLALPALRSLPAPQLQSLLAALDEMVVADHRITPFEFAIQHIIRRNLRAARRLPAPPAAPPAMPHARQDDVAAVLATVARAASKEEAASAAFTAGARHFGLRNDQLEEQAGGPAALSRLGVVLPRLERVPLPEKKRLLEALAIAASHDGAIEPDEIALLRAFAAALDCPAPVLER